VPKGGSPREKAGKGEAGGRLSGLEALRICPEGGARAIKTNIRPTRKKTHEKNKNRGHKRKESPERP